MTKPYIAEDSPLLRTIRSRATLFSQRVTSVVSGVSFYNYDTIEDTEISIYATLIVAAASLGGFSFGYCTAIISGVLVSIGADLDGEALTSLQQQSMASIASIAAIIGCLSCGLSADKLGRKPIIVTCCFLFSLASLQLSLCSSYIYFLAGRFLIGLLVGAASMVVPIYVSEVAPSRLRGSLMTLNSLGTTFGQLCAYLASALLENHPHSWRLMIILGSVAPVTFLFLSPFICESPRLLVMHNRIDEAFYCFQLIFPKAEEYQVHDKIKLIQKDLGIDLRTRSKPTKKQNMFVSLFKQKLTIRALVVGCGLFVAQQLSGISAFLNYSATLFGAAGLDNPLSAAIFIASLNFACTCINVVLIDILGRRRILLYTILVMALGLVAAGTMFGKIDSSVSIKSMTGSGVVLIISLVTYISFYAAGLGVVPWCSVEFLPQETRSAGTMVMSCVNWGVNYLVSSTFLDLTAVLNIGGTCFLYAFFGVVSWILVYNFYPEVAGLPLEEIGKIFENGYDITYAEQLRKDLGIGCDNTIDSESRDFSVDGRSIYSHQIYGAVHD